MYNRAPCRYLGTCTKIRTADSGPFLLVRRIDIRWFCRFTGPGPWVQLRGNMSCILVMRMYILNIRVASESRSSDPPSYVSYPPTHCQSGTTIWEYFVLECQSGLSKWFNHLGVFRTWYIQYVQKIHTVRRYKREVLRRSISIRLVHDWQLRTNETARLEETKFEEYIHAYTRVNRGQSSFTTLR